MNWVTYPPSLRGCVAGGCPGMSDRADTLQYGAFRRGR
ncbi:hypothetical protein FHS23_004036 [Prauserella isguenensis]|uniref:Uncharacterized protein n=1 Tax=Prauserella isguenensis TaxID=1470180 RepID=A0A839S6V8_9PSEU|nr:hypothetical protein [Prauserella isguenensis]